MTEAIELMAFNIADFEASDTALLHFQNARDDGPLMFHGKPVQARMRGPGTPEYTKAQAKIDSATQARMFAAMRNKAKDDLEEQRGLVNAKIKACTVELINFPIPGGVDGILGNPKLGYMRDQMARFAEDWANFPPSLATN